MPYSSKDDTVQERQLKVQSVSIPLTVVGNATPANVLLRNDEPSRLFLRSAAVDQITAQLATNETATYTTAAVDATGIFQVLFQPHEAVEKVVSASCYSRITGIAAPAFLGSATGISTGSAGGKSIMLVIDSPVDFTGANTFDACLVIEYVINEN